MYHEKSNQIHLALFILCVLSATFSPPYNQSSAQQNVIKEATGSSQSGMVQTIQTWWISNAKEEPNCWVECKIWMLTGIWIREEIAISLVDNCKALAENPVRCIKTGAFIVKSESGWWFNCKKSNQYNCFGLSVQEDYKSYNDGVLHFIWKYNRFWFRQPNPNGFYSNSPDWKPATRFCLSETSSWLPYCKNWHRIAWSVFNKLNF